MTTYHSGHRAGKPAGRSASAPQPFLSTHRGMPIGGQKLDRKTSREMSAKFGHDFSQVRIHSDTRAGESAEMLGANAYALGSDIVFGAGKYQPGSRETEKLLAHELTHVVQQDRWGAGDWGRASARGDASEQEADSLASQVAQGQRVQVQAAPGAAVAREEVEEKKEGTWNSFTDNPLWNYGTDDAVGGGIGLGVNKTDKIAEEAKETSTMREINQMEYRANHPGLPADADIAEDAMKEATAREASSAMAPAGRTAEEAEEAFQSASRWKVPGMALKTVGRIASPFSMYSDYNEMMENWEKGDHVGAAASGAGMVSAGVGTVEAAGAGASALGGLGGVGGALTSAAEFLNPVGAVLGAAAAGYEIGGVLNKHTDVPIDTEDTLGGIDSLLGGSPGHSKIVEMDDRRQELWDEGGAWNDTKSIAYGAGEAGIATAGAIGGIGKWGGRKIGQGAEWVGGKAADAGSWIWDHTFGGGPDVDMEDMNKAQADLNQTMDARDLADEEKELYGGGNQVAHEEMPPLPVKGR